MSDSVQNIVLVQVAGQDTLVDEDRLDARGPRTKFCGLRPASVSCSLGACRREKFFCHATGAQTD